MVSYTYTCTCTRTHTHTYLKTPYRGLENLLDIGFGLIFVWLRLAKELLILPLWHSEWGENLSDDTPLARWRPLIDLSMSLPGSKKRGSP